MDKAYADTVRLLLAVAPEVFASNLFAMKGGTAINLFVRDMPRLSVDIDVVYLPWQTPRAEALAQIAEELREISRRLKPLQVRQIPSKELGELKLLIEDADVQVKVEVNGIFRGAVRPIEPRALTKLASDRFTTDLTLPILAPEELYGSKLVAALDRQHPRDLFDVWQLLEAEGLSEGIVECFVTYLAGHNRPTHEVLFSNDKNITSEFETNFAGMTEEPVTLETLLAARSRLREELHGRLTDRHRTFLTGLTRAQPDWTLLEYPYAAELPALRWKLTNLLKFSKNRPEDFERQARELEFKLTH
jgi:predicted nucleotidyltransferase component of viral defense system